MLIALYLCALYGFKKKTATFALYWINWLVFITEVESFTVR